MMTPSRRTSVALTTAVLLLGGCRAPFEPDNGPVIEEPGTALPAVPFKVGFTGPDFARAVVADGSGNAYVAGYFNGTVDFDPTSGATARIARGASDISIAKYTATGALSWVFGFGGTETDTPFDIKLGTGGALYVTGAVSTGALCSGRVVPNAGAHDILLMRVNASGNCEWALGIGSTGEDEGHALMVEPSGDVVLTGFFSGTVDFDPGPGTAVLVSRGGHDGFIARFGSDGAFKNVSQFGGVEEDEGNALARTVEGDLVVGGDFRGVATFGSALAPLLLTSVGESDFFVARYSSLMGLQWGFRGGGSGIDQVGLNSLVVDGLGRIWVAGNFTGVADLDGSAGAILVTAVGGSDLFLARYDGTGAWAGVARAIGGSGSEGADNLLVDGANNLYLAGWFQGSVDFDPTTAATQIVVARGTQGAGDGFVLSLTTDGEFRWVAPIGSVIAGDANLGIASGLAYQAATGSLWAVGRFFGQVTYSPALPTLQAQSLGDADMYVIRLDPATGLLKQ